MPSAIANDVFDEPLERPMIATHLRWRLCLAVLLGSCVLTACGGDDSTQPTPSPTTPDTPKPPVDAGTPPQMRCAP